MTLRTALLIEDDPAQAALVQTVLGLAGGWIVDHASSLAQGEEMYAAHPADVIILDLGLPDAEGPEPLQPLQRALTWSPAPAIVVLTAHGHADLGPHAVDRGAQDFMAKSAVTPVVLPRVLDYAVRRHLAVVRASIRETNAAERSDGLAAYAEAVSRDLRAPIASLISMANMAVTLAEDSPVIAEELARALGPHETEGVATLVHVMRRVEALGRRALSFTDDILTNAEQGSADRALLDFPSLVDDAWQLVGHEGITLTVGALPIGVFGLESATRQALVQLLRNACAHVKPGTGQIRVDGADGDGHARITVHDDGPGVPVRARATIFNDGVSGDDSAGRGLALVVRQMQRQGGRVWAEDSAPLGGASFVLEFPSRGSSRRELPAR